MIKSAFFFRLYKQGIMNLSRIEQFVRKN
jgi:hypothetical protein